MSGVPTWESLSPKEQIDLMQWKLKGATEVENKPGTFAALMWRMMPPKGDDRTAFDLQGHGGVGPDSATAEANAIANARRAGTDIEGFQRE